MEHSNLLDVLNFRRFSHIFASRFVQKVGVEMQPSQ